MMVGSCMALASPRNSAPTHGMQVLVVVELI